MADQQYSTLTKLGFGVLALNSAFAIYTSWGDAGSVAIVLLADAALLLLFLCLREFERGGRGRETTRIKAAVWCLTTLLMAMFSSRVAPTMPLAVGVLVFLCLRDVVHQVRGGEGGDGRINMAEQYCPLAKVGLAVLTCNAALDTYDTRRDPGSAASVFASYVVLVVLTGLFVREFARAHAGGQGQEQHYGNGAVSTAMFASWVAPLNIPPGPARGTLV